MKRKPTHKETGRLLYPLRQPEVLTASHYPTGKNRIGKCHGRRSLVLLRTVQHGDASSGMGKIKNYEQEIAAADYPGIRLFQVKKHTSVAPLDAYQVESTMGGWKECSPSTVPEFSAVAYLYARELHQKLNVPVGVIDCTWGGTPAEAWTSSESLKQVMGYQKKVGKLEALGFDRDKIMAEYGKNKHRGKPKSAK